MDRNTHFTSDMWGGHFEPMESVISQTSNRFIDVYRHKNSDQFDSKAAYDYARGSISKTFWDYLPSSNKYQGLIDLLGFGDNQKAYENNRKKLAKKKQDFAKKQRTRNKEEGDNDKSLKFSGPYVYNAISGKLEEDTPSAVEMTDGSYKRIEFKLKRNWDAGEDEGLFGKVFVIKGNYTVDGVTTPFEIYHHVAINFRLLGEGAFKVESNEQNALSIVFDLKKWFEGIDLSTADKDLESGAIIIDKTANKEILKILKKNIKTHSRFGKDSDGNGSLADTEVAGEGEVVADAGDE